LVGGWVSSQVAVRRIVDDDGEAGWKANVDYDMAQPAVLSLE